jgi:hypothetical protein
MGLSLRGRNRMLLKTRQDAWLADYNAFNVYSSNEVSRSSGFENLIWESTKIYGTSSRFYLDREVKEAEVPLFIIFRVIFLFS